jgi:chromosome segregation protein
MEEKQIIDRLWDTYEMTRSAAMAVRAELASVTDARRRITELKREISDLGSPNIARSTSLSASIHGIRI